MEPAQSAMHQMLVVLFNHILRIEERSLSFPGLSIREVHVIEAVCEAQDSRITALARQLRVTTGSLSVALSTLERKGYVSRVRRLDDRRMVNILPTEKALAIHAKHQSFHREMIDAVAQRLTGQELDILIKALEGVDSYFTSRENMSL